MPLMPVYGGMTMNKNRKENLRMRQRYIVWLKEAEELSKKTADKAEVDITKFEEFLDNRALKKLTSDQIVSFKHKQKNSGITVSTYCSRIRNIRRYLNWLMVQKGYKQRLNPALVKYMSANKEDKRRAQLSAFKESIPLPSVYKLIDSISGNNPIDMRDRAIISLLITTGIRHKALVTLPVGCVHLSDGFIEQDSRRGVATKFSKNFKSAIIPICDNFIQCLKDWDYYLRQNGYRDKDPFFPKAKQEMDTEARSFEKATEVVPQFWKSHRSLSDVLRKRFQNAGLPYFPPHSFRHLLVKLAKEADLTSKQSKCFSQSLGHEHENTTYGSYGKFSEEEYISTVKDIDFSRESTNSNFPMSLDGLGKIIEDKVKHELSKNGGNK